MGDEISTPCLNLDTPVQISTCLKIDMSKTRHMEKNVKFFAIVDKPDLTSGRDARIVRVCGSMVGSHQRKDDDHDQNDDETHDPETCRQTRSRCAERRGAENFRAQGDRPARVHCRDGGGGRDDGNGAGLVATIPDRVTPAGVTCMPSGTVACAMRQWWRIIVMEVDHGTGGHCGCVHGNDRT